MTKEIAIHNLFALKLRSRVPSDRDALGIAIKALEQQPSDDCVSRKAVNMLSIDLVYVTGDKADFLCKFWTGLDALPSVTPKAKTGHWIMKHRSYSEMKYLTGTDEMGIEHTVKKYESCEIDEPYCSECGKLAGDTSQNYCCACGVKMDEESKTEQALAYADQDTLMPAT